MLYVPDPVQPAGQPSGGSFIRTPTVSTSSASLLIKTRVKNDYAVAKTCVLKTTILSPANAVVATISTTQSIAAGASYLFVQNGTVSSPTLWSVANPARYTAVSEVSDNTTPVDTFTERFGIRSILFNTNGFFLNGTNVKLFGVNRHQMYPYIGGALPDNGQRREALLLKTMGCNYIRLSHYPQAPAFMDALDSLGIMAWEEVPTWQGGAVNTAWINRHHQNIIDMIRRDRNHPCILIWGVGINEGVDDQTFEGGCQAVAKSEDSTHYTSHGKNWNDPSDIAFDIYGGNRFYPNELPGSAASEGIGTGNLVGYVNSEYVGHTFTTGRFNPAHHQINQTARFEQQVTADRNAAWIAGGTGWCAFDYNSRAGWAASGVTIDGDNVPGQGISYHGVCDIFRIPKFSYYFHQAQSASDNYSGSVHPMVFIESFGDYAMPSTQTIKVQSNCDQVELFVNGVSLGTKSPDTQTPAVDGIPATTTNLAHPPFTFTNVAYSSPGTIRADGKIGGVVKATQTVYAQGTAAKIVLIPDADTVYADGADIVRVVVQVVDANNQVVNASTATVNVAASGAGKVICGSAGPVASGSVTLEAGQLAFLVQAGTSAGTIAVTATSGSLTQTQHTFVVPGQSVGVREPRLIPVSLDVAAMPAIRMEGRKIVFENLDMKIPSRIMLVSMDGRIAKALTSTGKTSAVFPVSLFPAGVYTAIVEVGSKNVRKNVVVLK
jgi:beta-galactosidase